MGAEIKYETCHAMIKRPHSERHTQHDPLRETGQDGLASRYAPQVGTFPHDTDPDPGQLRISQQHYLPDDVAPGDGGTMIWTARTDSRGL